MGFIVTWDVNSADRRGPDQMRRFIYGSSTCAGGRLYQYPGFIERDGVRYLGQSVLFVPNGHIAAIDSWFAARGIDHEAMPAVLG